MLESPPETRPSGGGLLHAGPHPTKGPKPANRGAVGGPPWRVTYLVSHPIQYQAPLLAKLADLPWLDLEVAFRSDVSVRDFEDTEFDTNVAWDVPLTEGYRHRFLPGSHRRPTRLGPWNRGLAELVHPGRTDVLWMHGYSHPVHLRALSIARRRGIRVLARGESNLLGRPTSGPAAALRRLALQRLFERFDGFLTIGSANAEFYRHHGVGDDRLFPMPYAVDNERFVEQAERARAGRAALRRELRIDPKAPVVLFCGKLIEKKGVRELLEAHLACSSRHARAPRPVLVIVGSGALEGELRARSRERTDASVRFVGFRNQTELPAYYDLADLFVVPSRFEPWGLVVNEAMCAGVPVLASDAVGAAADLIAEGRTGYRFPAGDVHALTRRLDELVFRAEGTESLERAGAAARERVLEWGFDADAAGLFRALEIERRRAA